MIIITQYSIKSIEINNLLWLDCRDHAWPHTSRGRVNESCEGLSNEAYSSIEN